MPRKVKQQNDIVRSSAAEYLTFITATGEGDVNAVYADENVWLTQKMMGVLYQVETPTINYHLKKAFADGELSEESVIRKFRITAADGKTCDFLIFRRVGPTRVGPSFSELKKNLPGTVAGETFGSGKDRA